MAIFLPDQAISALIGGSVGGLLAAGLRWIEQRSERRRRRRALATALLDDLRVLELDMRELVKVDLAAEVASRPMTRPGELFRRVKSSDDLFLFKPRTVSKVLSVASLVATIEDLGAIYPKVTESSRPRLHHGVRAKAWFIAKDVSNVRDALLAEGGTPPPREPFAVLDGFEIPDLGPPAFTEWTVPPRPPSEGVWVDKAGRPRPK